MKKLLAVFALALSLVACGDHEPPRQTVVQQAPAPVQAQQAPQVVAAPAPVVVQQAPSHDGLLTGMLVGSMLMNGGGSRGGDTHVTKNVTVNKTYTPAPAAAPAPTYRPSTSYSPARTSSFSSSRSFSSGRR